MLALGKQNQVINKKFNGSLFNYTLGKAISQT